FNYQQLVNPFSSISTISVPTDAMKAGCFDPGVFGNSLTLDAAHGGTSLTPNAAQCGAFNPADLAIPTSDFDPVAVNIQNDYVTATNQNLVQNNYTFLSSGTNNSKKTFGRLDYNLSAKNRINITVLMHDNPHKQFNSPLCPISCQLFAAEGYNTQFTDVYHQLVPGKRISVFVCPTRKLVCSGESGQGVSGQVGIKILNRG